MDFTAAGPRHDINISMILPTELSDIACGLERRLSLLRVPCRKIPMDEWESLEPEIKQHIPMWLRTLLSSYSLAGGVLGYPDLMDDYERIFRFFEPAEYREILDPEGIFSSLIASGYLPFADEAHGNTWVAKVTNGESEAIQLLEISRGADEAGFIFASSRLSLLLASMEVSISSYTVNSVRKTSVLWHKEL